jgi:hypothetical protein
MLLTPCIRQYVHGHLIKKVQRWLQTNVTRCFKSWSFHGNRIQRNRFGQTAASRCKSSQTFQGLTPSPSSSSCWRLGKTKTDEQVPYCAAYRTLFVLGPENGDGVNPWNVEQLPHIFAASCQRFHCYLMLHIVGDHTDLQRVTRWPLSWDSTVCIARSIGTGQTCKIKQLTLWLKCNQPLQQQNLELEKTSYIVYEIIPSNKLTGNVCTFNDHFLSLLSGLLKENHF